MDEKRNEESNEDEDGSIERVEGESISQVVELLLETSVTFGVILGY